MKRVTASAGSPIKYSIAASGDKVTVSLLLSDSDDDVKGSQSPSASDQTAAARRSLVAAERRAAAAAGSFAAGGVLGGAVITGAVAGTASKSPLWRDAPAVTPDGASAGGSAGFSKLPLWHSQQQARDAPPTAASRHRVAALSTSLQSPSIGFSIDGGLQRGAYAMCNADATGAAPPAELLTPPGEAHSALVGEGADSDPQACWFD